MKLLIIMVIFAGYYCDEQTGNEESIKTCKTFLEKNPKPQEMLIYKGQNSDANYGQFIRKSGKYRLLNAIKFHQISSVVEEEHITTICTSVEDTTSYTQIRRGSDYSYAAWVTFNTRIAVATSIVNVTTVCWRKHKDLSMCNPIFIPMPGLMESALYNYSPLDEEFWRHVQDDTLYDRNWIWRMNFRSNEGSINSSWVSQLRIHTLTELEIIGNDWRRPERLLGPLQNLRKLDLTDNNIEIMPNDAFDNLPQLYYINLGHNNISKLPYGIQNLERIDIVDLTNPTGNATLAISNDEILTLSKVRTLGLERTRLYTNISSILKLPNLSFLNLSGCFLGKIEDNSERISQNSNLVVLDLSFNNISKLPENIFSNLNKLKIFLLHDNLFESCPKDSLHTLDLLETLDFSRNNFTVLKSDCLSRLKNIKELDLSWNNLILLETLMFKDMKNLKKLILSHNKLSILNDAVLLPSLSLKTLDISFNHLVQAPTLGEVDLNILDLSHNTLTSVINMTTSIKRIQHLDFSWNSITELKFEKVSTLNLSFNSLVHISSEMWGYLDDLEYLDLGGNDFNCCHNDTTLLQHKINDSPEKYKNLNGIQLFTCSINEEQKVLLETFQYNATACMEPSGWGVTLFIEVGVPLVFLLCLVGVITIMLYFYRTELTYISHLFKMKKRGWQKDEERYNVCSYDAFVCYNGKNFKWIMDELLPNLESEPGGYRLCLHDRDFTLGAAIDTNVIVSLEKSRKVIFILTQDFIGSRWCQWELEMANHKMFEENRSYIILIELERLDKQSMPRHLRYLMDTRTYLEWPHDPTDEYKIQRCYKRLRHAMGDSILKRTGKGPPKCSVLDL